MATTTLLTVRDGVGTRKGREDNLSWLATSHRRDGLCHVTIIKMASKYGNVVPGFQFQLIGTVVIAKVQTYAQMKAISVKITVII